MDKLWRRLRFYLIGFGLGLVVFYFIERNREGSNWLPQDVVIANILDSTVTVEPGFNCLNLTKAQLRNAIRGGDVKFGKSDVNSGPCPKYLVAPKLDFVLVNKDTVRNVRFWITLCEVSTVAVQKEDGTSLCD